MGEVGQSEKFGLTKDHVCRMWVRYVDQTNPPPDHMARLIVGVTAEVWRAVGAFQTDHKESVMTVEKVAMYRTSDGRTFEDVVEAERHQRKLDFQEWCRQKVCRGGEWSSDMVAEAVLGAWDVSPKVTNSEATPGEVKVYLDEATLEAVNANVVASGYCPFIFGQPVHGARAEVLVMSAKAVLGKDPSNQTVSRLIGQLNTLLPVRLLQSAPPEQAATDLRMGETALAAINAEAVKSETTQFAFGELIKAGPRLHDLRRAIDSVWRGAAGGVVAIAGRRLLVELERSPAPFLLVLVSGMEG